MSLSKNINTYSDIEKVLRAARAAGGARYTLESEGKAHRWRQRAYMFRKLLIGQAMELALPGHIPTTPYDTMRLTIEGPTVLIRFDMDLSGQLVTLDGTQLSLEDEPTFSPIEDVDDNFNLSDIAAKLADELNNE